MVKKKKQELEDGIWDIKDDIIKIATQLLKTNSAMEKINKRLDDLTTNDIEKRIDLVNKHFRETADKLIEIHKQSTFDLNKIQGLCRQTETAIKNSLECLDEGRKFRAFHEFPVLCNHLSEIVFRSETVLNRSREHMECLCGAIENLERANHPCLHNLKDCK